MGRMRVIALAVLLGVLALAPGGALAEDDGRLISIIRGDPSFKVRMRAIEILAKNMAKQGRGAASWKRGVEALSDAATSDSSHLVRGLAVVTLAELKEPKAKSILERALRDESSFVREKAQAAMKAYAGPPPSTAGGAVLVVSLESMPGVEVPSGLVESFRSSLLEQAKDIVGGRYRVETATGGKGFRFHAGIASRQVQEVGGQVEVTLVVRIAVMTSPENYLRHVVTSKAKARTGSTSKDAIERLERQVMVAAVKRAVRDAVAEIDKT